MTKGPSDFLLFDTQKSRPCRSAGTGFVFLLRDHSSLDALYRKVTAWARVQPWLGPKLAGVVPAAMPFSAAQSTALV